jgi:hypothetical protein
MHRLSKVGVDTRVGGVVGAVDPQTVAVGPVGAVDPSRQMVGFGRQRALTERRPRGELGPEPVDGAPAAGD